VRVVVVLQMVVGLQVEWDRKLCFEPNGVSNCPRRGKWGVHGSAKRVVSGGTMENKMQFMPSQARERRCGGGSVWCLGGGAAEMCAPTETVVGKTVRPGRYQPKMPVHSGAAGVCASVRKVPPIGAHT